MKTCNKCNQIKCLTDFVKHKGFKDGYRPTCKECKRLESRQEYLTRIAKPIYNPIWSKQYYEANKERIRTAQKNYYNRNTHVFREAAMARKAGIKRATPPWVNRDELRQIYKNCPKGMHVDHIHPLNGKHSCGLHVPWNLQYLTPQENMRKSNKCPT